MATKRMKEQGYWKQLCFLFLSGLICTVLTVNCSQTVWASNTFLFQRVGPKETDFKVFSREEPGPPKSGFESCLVDNSGGFQYTYPITLPSKGLAGMAPSLALVYNSNAGNGILGVGWNLTGFPTITRDPAYGISFDNSDHFLYSGQKLIPGGDGYYHTELESFLRIKAENMDSASSYWVVTQKDGTQLYFGYRNTEHTTKSDGHIDAVGKNGKAACWALSKVMDTKGNYYIIEYNEDNENGDYYPLRITYTKNEIKTIPANCTIEFSYELRQDKGSMYQFASKVYMDRRMRWITIKLGNKLFKKYRIDYEYGTSTGRSRVTGIQEFGCDGDTPPILWGTESYLGSGKKLPMVNFKWQDSGSCSFTREYTSSYGIAGFDLSDSNDNVFGFDYNGDGKTDLCMYRKGKSSGQNIFCIAKSNGDGTFAQVYKSSYGIAGYEMRDVNDTVFPFDYNGDGKADLCLYRYGRGSGQGKLYILKSNGDGTFTAVFTSNYGVTGFELENANDRIFPFDYNGDGKMDLCLYRYGGGSGQSKFHILNSKGDGTFKSVYSSNYGIAGYSMENANDRVFSFDYNGDGRSDLCFYRFGCGSGQGKFTIAKSNGNGTFTAIYQSNYGIGGFAPTDPNDKVFPLDYNGDGKTDLCLYRNGYSYGSNKLYVVRSNGDETFTPIYTSSFGAAGFYLDNMNDEVTAFDYNHDGRDDLCLYRKGCGYGNGLFTIARSNGETFTLAKSSQYGLNSFSLEDANDEVLPLDYNGDGKSDLCMYRRGKGLISINKADGLTSDVLNTISDGFGSVTVTYGIATQLSGTVDSTDKSYPNIANKNPLTVVTKLSMNNGFSSSSGQQQVINTSFTYANRIYHLGQPSEQMDLGFESIQRTDSAGGYETTYFHQDDIAMEGMIKQKTNYGSDQKKYLDTGYEYTKKLIKDNSSDPEWQNIQFIELFSETINNYNAETGSPVQYRTEYGYDEYGNVNLVKNEGDTSVTGDEVRTETSYNYYIDSYRYLMLPAVERKYGVKLNGIEGLAEENRFFYNSDYTLERREMENGDNDVAIKYGYDDFGNVISVTDGNNNITTYTFDENFYTFVRTRTSKFKEEIVYDELMRPVRWIDVNGQTWETTYDVFSREKSKIFPGDSVAAPTMEISYPDEYLNTNGNPFFPKCFKVGQKVADGKYIETYTYFDGLDRVVQTKKTDPNGWVTVDQAYDTAGRKKSTTQPYQTTSLTYTSPDKNVKASLLSYDPIGRVAVTTNPDTTSTRVFYTKHDTLMVDELGHVTNRSVTGNTEYNIRYTGVYPEQAEYSKQKKTVACDGIKTIDPVGKEFITYTDLLGRTVQTSNPVNGTWSFEYDANNNCVAQTDAKNQTIKYEYDELNRVKKKIYPDKSQVVYDYDDPAYINTNGRLTSISYPGGEESYTYDIRGRKEAVTQVINGLSRKMSYTYNTADQIIKQVYPDGEEVSYSYDNGAFLHGVNGAASYVASIGYQPSGKISKILYGNGVQTDYDYYDTASEYDNTSGTAFSNRLKQIRAYSAEKDLLNLTYEYDKSDNVRVRRDSTNSDLTEQYGYDDLNRLTDAASTGYGTKTFRYDTLNNILSKDNRTYQYDLQHPYMVSDDGKYTYSYDANGNQAKRGDGRVLNWDFDNRLTSVSNGAIYTYDAGGQRISKVENGVTTYYFFNEYEEEYQSGKKTKAVKYYFANNQRVAENSTVDGVRYYIQDHLESTSAIANANGELVLKTNYAPYGETVVSNGDGKVRYTFTGKEQDGTGLYYFGARYYDSEMGRFISVDPIGDGDNWYAYCRNNPIIYIDPNGLYTGYGHSFLTRKANEALGIKGNINPMVFGNRVTDEKDRNGDGINDYRGSEHFSEGVVDSRIPNSEELLERAVRAYYNTSSKNTLEQDLIGEGLHNREDVFAHTRRGMGQNGGETWAVHDITKLVKLDPDNPFLDPHAFYRAYLDSCDYLARYYNEIGVKTIDNRIDEATLMEKYRVYIDSLPKKKGEVKY